MALTVIYCVGCGEPVCDPLVGIAPAASLCGQCMFLGPARSRVLNSWLCGDIDTDEFRQRYAEAGRTPCD